MDTSYGKVAVYNFLHYFAAISFLMMGSDPARLSFSQYLQLRNARGHTLLCSHYLPSPLPEDTPLPCVIYCHGNRYRIIM
jgi:hypothetical protein